MIKENVSLKNHNTFGIDVKTKFLVEIFSEGELLKILKSKIKGPFRVLGSGSNVLLTKNYDGHTIIMKNKGIEVQDQTKTDGFVKIRRRNRPTNNSSKSDVNIGQQQMVSSK